MKPLSENWITERTLDFEYKKYVLLAWLQSVEDDFKTIRLYPALGELIAHYRRAVQLRQNKTELSNLFPKQLKGISKDGLSAEFESLIEDDEMILALERILEFSIPKLEEHVQEGKTIYEFVESGIEISPVGIVPLRTNEGYLFLSQGSQDTKVYSYSMTLYTQGDSPWRALRTEHIADWKRSITNSFEAIKTDLIRINKTLPNPAVYAAVSGHDIPYETSFLPVAKRMLLKTISAA
jgi:hypothetical protein